MFQIAYLVVVDDAIEHLQLVQQHIRLGVSQVYTQATTQINVVPSVRVR